MFKSQYISRESRAACNPQDDLFGLKVSHKYYLKPPKTQQGDLTLGHIGPLFYAMSKSKVVGEII